MFFYHQYLSGSIVASRTLSVILWLLIYYINIEGVKLYKAGDYANANARVLIWNCLLHAQEVGILLKISLSLPRLVAVTH